MGDQIDYGMRVYDPRAGRFLSVDPIAQKYPELTPYQFASNRPIDGADLDGKEWDLRTTVIRNLQGRAFQMQDNAATTKKKWESYAEQVFKRSINLNTDTKPLQGTFEQQQRTEFAAAQYQKIGLNDDGSKPFLRNLAENKTWKNFSENVALPLIDGYLLLDGGESLMTFSKELASIYKAGRARKEIISTVERTLSSTASTVKQLDAEAMVGYRGSLATGVKYKTGAPFDHMDFDVDAFIVSDKLAKKFAGAGFRNGRRIGELRNISNSLEEVFKQFPGYRIDPKKPFTFRIFTTKEFEKIVKPNGFKTVN